MGKRRLKKSTAIYLIVVFSALLVLACCLAFYVYKSKNLQLNFAREITEVQYGSEFDPVALKLDNASLGLDDSYEIIYPKVQTSEVGEKEYIFVLKQGLFRRKFNHIINIIDTTPPEFEVKYYYITLENSNYNFERNVKDRIVDNHDGNIPIREMKYIGEIGQEPGVYEVRYEISDSSGNVASKTVYFLYKLRPENMKEPFYFQYNGTKHILANKWVPLPKKYSPGADKTAREQLTKMRNAMSKAGVGVAVASGYRSYSTQSGLFSRYAAKAGAAEANRYSARAGYSEHQTGLAYDIGKVSESFANTKSFAWLQEHAHEYGFIMRYPENSEKITGYIYEPWHYRYVGVELATAVKESGLTLEEFIGYTYTP